MVYDNKASLLVNKVIPVSNVDGPGNRYSIFLQECNLNCLYCHNPETINLCISCGGCIGACEHNALSMVGGRVIYDQLKCTDCDSCLTACMNSSNPKSVRESVDSLVSAISRYRSFLSGITVSGGECTIQHEGLTALFKEVKSRFPELSTAVDTNGMFDRVEIDELIKYTDMFIFDVKSIQMSEHQSLTGKTNIVVLENLEHLIHLNKIYEVRTVICPPLIKPESTVIETAKLLSGTDINYKLIKYRPMGVRKRICPAIVPDDKTMLKLYMKARKLHSRVSIT